MTVPADAELRKLQNTTEDVASSNDQQSTDRQEGHAKPSIDEPLTNDHPENFDNPPPSDNKITAVTSKSPINDQAPERPKHPPRAVCQQNQVQPVQEGQSSGKNTKAGYSENGEVTLLPDTPTTPSTPGEAPPIIDEPRVYKKRWLILLLFSVYSMSSAYHWIHLNIIGHIIHRYYNESLPGNSLQQQTTVDCLAMIYMISYIPLIFPATWLLDKKGLRVCVLSGCCLNCVGAWLKCASVGPDRFTLLMFAQTTCAVAQVFVIGIPARLAAVWFGPNEVSTATSFGVFGNQIGVAVGFLIPPVLVSDTLDFDVIAHDLSIMLYGGAAFATIIFIAVIFVFQNEPKRPPSLARMLVIRSDAKQQHYIHSLLRLVRNRGFVILVISYGINTGCYYAISTLLNSIVLHYFEGEGENAGRIGLTIILMGILGAIAAGYWLDKTRMYKATSLGIYLMSMAGMLLFTFTVDQGQIWLVFVSAGSLGLFMTGYLPVGFEFAAEITFPESEGTSSGLLNASSQVFGIIFTIGMRAMGEKLSMFSANITATVLLLGGTIMTAFIRADYRRQAAAATMRNSLAQVIDVVKEEKHASATEPLTLSE